MIEIQVAGLEKDFSDGKQTKKVLNSINMDVEKGEIIAIRGNNGIGKTTLFNILAGIESPTKGSINFSGVEKKKIRIGYTQQDYTSSLLPWFDVLDNVSIPLRLLKVPKPERRQRADQLLSNLGFDNLPRDAYPHQLSGGQKQRVALARALFHEPHALFLDEPFANLDAQAIKDIQDVISQIHHKKQLTIVYITHELDHIYLADRVFLLHGKPAKFIDEFKVNLPRPRKRNMTLSYDYGNVRSHILTREEKLYDKI